MTGTQRLLGLELLTTHVAESQRFYNWLIDPDMTGEQDAAVARSLRSKGVITVRDRESVAARNHWLPVFMVDDVDSVPGIGGTDVLALPALESDPLSVRYFADSEGIVTGVVGVDQVGTRVSRLGGTNVDYITTDPARTAAEQGAALGLDVYRMIDDAFDAHLLCDGNFVAAGVLRFGSTFKDDASPGWLCYLGVDDIDGAITRAMAAGARILVPASFSGLNRYAVLEDPWGSPFGVSTELPSDAADDLWLEGPHGRLPLEAFATMM